MAAFYKSKRGIKKGSMASLVGFEAAPEARNVF